MNKYKSIFIIFLFLTFVSFFFCLDNFGLFYGPSYHQFYLRYTNFYQFIYTYYYRIRNVWPFHFSGLYAMHLICVHQSQAFVFILSENYSETVYVPIDKKLTTRQKINYTQANPYLYYIVCRNIT